MFVLTRMLQHGSRLFVSIVDKIPDYNEVNIHVRIQCIYRINADGIICYFTRH